MINWFDMPAEGLSNGGLFEVKELEVTENGTYETKGEMYNKVTVNVEGGGSSWQTVFEGSVTTVEAGGYNEGTFRANITANTIKVTFNGTEYTCEKLEDNSFGAPYDNGTRAYDWSEYPFSIYPSGDSSLTTQTAGTYTLKIEEQSGGGSFSTAVVTIINNAEAPISNMELILCAVNDTPSPTCLPFVYVNAESTATVNVALYKGHSSALMQSAYIHYSVSGNATDDGFGEIDIYGNCTITIS